MHHDDGIVQFNTIRSPSQGWFVLWLGLKFWFAYSHTHNLWCHCIEKLFDQVKKPQNVSVLTHYLLDYQVYLKHFLKVSVVLKIWKLIRLN